MRAPSSASRTADVAPALPKPWTTTREPAHGHAQVRRRRLDAIDGASGGRLGATLGATQRDRLARDDAGHGVSRVHRVGVHHPGHDLGIGVDVGCRDVLLGTDEHAQLGREAARQALQLTLGELLGVDHHAALAATERDAHHGALPGHPHGEGLDLVEVDVLVVPDAALGRPADDVVVDAIAGEDAHACRRPSSPGSGHLNSRWGSRSTRRMPGSSWSSSAARSNCRCATCQVLMVWVACSMVMHGMRDPREKRRAPSLIRRRAGSRCNEIEPTVHRTTGRGPSTDGTEALPARNLSATRCAIGRHDARPPGRMEPHDEPHAARRPAQTRHCLVTGASSGIGRAVAERLARGRLDRDGPRPTDVAPPGTRVVVGDATSGRPTSGRASTVPRTMPARSRAWCARPACRHRGRGTTPTTGPRRSGST